MTINIFGNNILKVKHETIFKSLKICLQLWVYKKKTELELERNQHLVGMRFDLNEGFPLLTTKNYI